MPEVPDLKNYLKKIAPSGGSAPVGDFATKQELEDLTATVEGLAIPTDYATTTQLDALAATVGTLVPSSPDEPGEMDDEFDGTSDVVWVPTANAPALRDITTTPGQLRLRASGSGNQLVGQLQAAPSAFPYTIDTVLRSTSVRQNYHRAGIVLATANGQFANCAVLGVTHADGTAKGYAYTTSMNGGENFATPKFTVVPKDLYMRVKVNSAHSFDFQMSSDGKAWWPVLMNWDVDQTPAFIGLVVSEETNNTGVDAFFDYFRVTTTPVD